MEEKRCVTDIFIKTWPGDFKWLRYCLASIRKFARGFRHVVIVSDKGEEHVPFDALWSDCRVCYVAVQSLESKNKKAKKKEDNNKKQNGYLWQQCVKLNWWKYTNAEAVFIMDSDWMFTKPTTPEDFYTNGKPHWFFRNWNEKGSEIIWKHSLEELMKCSSSYEAMCISGFTLLRSTSLAFKNHFCTLHNVQEIWDVLKYVTTVSEFNMFGTFVYLYDKERYTLLLNEDFRKFHNLSIRAGWSWGGFGKEEQLICDAILHS